MRGLRFCAVLLVAGLVALGCSDTPGSISGPDIVALPTFANLPGSSCDAFVSEASGYTLVYTLQIPENADYNNTLPPYSVDNTASIGSFDRVAYCVQLDDDLVWVSMDAFTTVPAQVGVPVTSTGAVFQQTVSNMNVFSNVASIVTGTGITTGNIEFWHNCYERDNTLGLPGASNALYDFDDRPNGSGSCYGSMQVHNHGTGTGLPQTLFSYNAWDHPDFDADDLGIGNNTVLTVDNVVNPDWTFRFNAGTDYSDRTMYILVSSGDPETKDDCKKGGWEDFGFRNQGQCIRYVNTGKDSR